jgi:hypothetical protein
VTKLAKKQEQIVNHAHKLHKIFPACASIRPATLYGLLAQLEREGSKLAEDKCNRPMAESEYERRKTSIDRRVREILRPDLAGIKLILNCGDPRGCALKIDDADMRRLWEENKLAIERDWGGYGIIAPNFDEE